MGKPRPRYAPELKQRAVRLCRELGGTYAGLARELGCDMGGISDWVGKADAAGADPSANPFQVAEENRRLKRGRNAFKSERLLRQQAAVGAQAERARFAFVLPTGGWSVSAVCSALKVTRQGHCAWRSRPPSAHATKGAELAELISRVRAEIRGICGAPKTFMRLRAAGCARRASAPASCVSAAGAAWRARARRSPRARSGRPDANRRPTC